MSDQSGRTAASKTPRLELLIAFATLVIGGLIGLVGLILAGSELWIPLAILLASGLVLNLVILVLDRRGVPEGIIVWSTRLVNLAVLTGGIYFTGAFRSPFLTLYALYLVVAGLRYGWRGTIRTVILCVTSWAVLAVLSPPIGLEERTWAGVSVANLLIFALALGALAQRHVSFRQEAVRRNEELTFLREASQSLGASLDPQTVLAATLARVNELLDVEAASLALVDSVTGRITFELAIGGGNETVRGLRLEPGEGIVGHVIQENQAILVSNVTKDSRWFQGVDDVSGYQTRSILCVPLRGKGQVLGALEALNKRDGPFTQEDLRLLSSLAGLAAQAIENARLHDQIRQNVEKLQDAYEELQKLDDLKSSFIRNVSHELRTPLSLIEGYLEMVIDEQMGPLRPEQKRSLVVVKEKSEQLVTLVNDIISLQTIGTMGYDLEELSLVSLVEAAMEKARQRVEKASIRLKMELPDDGDLPLVRGDVRRLGQVLDHLLDNAIKFSPNGGTLTLSLARELDMVGVRVQDQGIGMSSDEMERIFDRFYQVDGSATRRFGGTGLGLALVKEVVEAHGGAVWVESEVGQGSTFLVFLPAIDGSSGYGAAATPA